MGYLLVYASVQKQTTGQAVYSLPEDVRTKSCAAEQRWEVACGETAGHRDAGTETAAELRRGSAEMAFFRRCSAASQFRLPHSLGSRSGLPTSAAPQPIALLKPNELIQLLPQTVG